MTILIIILLFEVYLLSRVLRYFLLSPIYIYVGFSIVSIVFSVWYFYFFDDKFSLFGLDNVSESYFLSIIKKYIIAIVSFLAGVIVYYDLSLKTKRKLFNKNFTESLFVKYKIPSSFALTSRVLFFIIIALYFITYGKGILIRPDYLPETNRAFTILIKILCFVEVILLALSYEKNKLISNVLFFLLILVSIGTGSRSVFLFFIVYIVVLFISTGNSLFNKLRFTFHLFLSLVFLAYIMELRFLDSHGVFPYIKSIFNSNGEYVRSFFFNIYYSFIYGVFVTIRTIKESQLDWNIIMVSINPMPGSMAGWYDYADKMRINLYAPYSLHGRVFKTGTIFTIIYFLITGIIFSYMEKRVRLFLNNGKRLIAFLVVLILILHIVYAFEYNMRAAIRYIYYAFFVILSYDFIKFIIPYLPRKKQYEE